MSCDMYSTSTRSREDKMEDEEDEEPGGLSLILPRREKAEASYTDEIKVEMLDDVTPSSPSQYTPFYVTLNEDLEEEKDTEPGGLSSLVLRPSPRELVADYTDEAQVEMLKNGGSDATQIQLMNRDVIELPESPDCPYLTSLSLQRNSDLTSIPASFFELMPNLREVDLSGTGVKSLPGSFFDLVTLEKLFLRNCQVVMELPAKIGQLLNLEVLDLEGTDIVQLPAEIGDLVNLTRLRVSFCQWSGDLGEATIVPEGALSKLAQLVELCLGVDPEDSRWEGAVKGVIKELVHLKKLKDLKMYVPQVELLGELTRNLPFLLGSSTTGYNLNVGSHMRRVMSPTPLGAEGNSQHGKKQLRYVNGKGRIPSQVKNLLKYSEALFLDRHFTVGNLSEFGMKNLGNLRYCMLGECNELKTIVEDWDGHDVYTNPVLPELQELIIYNMKTLTSISNAPLKDNSLSCLKTLKLHGCAQLRTIFVIESGISLVLLEEITVEDCPAVLSLVTCSKLKSYGQIGWSFPRLKKISLLYLTELQSIFSGLCNAPHLERLSVYDCPNLKTLSAKEISRVDRLKVINGEAEWWKALEWNESEDWKLQKLASVFVPIRSDADLETQLLAQDPIPDPDIDVERVLEEQETHDLYCPNCNSCITKRVILRRRKRKQRMAQHDEGQACGSGFDVESVMEKQETHDEGQAFGSGFDVEGVMEKQETHDLVCPNCHSCITRRVIFRRSQRKPKWPELVEHDDEGQGSVENYGPIEDLKPPPDRCFLCLLFFRCFGTV